MPKINDKLSIEIWKEIANYVQMLDFTKGGDDEFRENLRTLKTLLENINIDLTEGSRHPKKIEEVGLATFLQSIHFMGVTKHMYNKLYFYEQIDTLANLGVKEIEFRPIDFYDSIIGLKQIYYKRDDKTDYEKAYTDGTFELQTTTRIRKNDVGFIYNIVNLRDANFIIKVLLHKKHHPKETEPIQVKHISASLKNFKSSYPSQSHIMLDCFPNLIIPKQTIRFGEEVHDLQEDFESIPISDPNLAKKLVRDIKLEK